MILVDTDIVHSFSGVDWLEYDIPDSPLATFRDELSFSFKTNRQTGLLFHAGVGPEYMNLVLIEGSLRFAIFVFDNVLSIDFDDENGYKTFADGLWHSVLVKRKIEKVRSI